MRAQSRVCHGTSHIIIIIYAVHVLNSSIVYMCTVVKVRANCHIWMAILSRVYPVSMHWYMLAFSETIGVTQCRTIAGPLMGLMKRKIYPTCMVECPSTFCDTSFVCHVKDAGNSSTSRLKSADKQTFSQAEELQT